MAKKTADKATGATPSPDAARMIVRGNANRHVVASSSFVSLYANDVELQTTPWDVRLTFGELSVAPDADGVPSALITQVGQVRLSPQIAKRVLFILAQQLQTYEAAFGPIPQPKED
jgi:hypothetical protein